jgi:uncharacterized protein YjbI with pentapeptide repeats
MMSILLPIIIILSLFILAGFFWIWWALPRDQVPHHLSEEELRRLEVQDRLRQTNYQILTALGLGATFLVTVFQLTMVGRQWSSDYELKVAQDKLNTFGQAIKLVGESGLHGASIVAGVRLLHSLALQDPVNYHFQANSFLATLVSRRAQKEFVTDAFECNPWNGPYERRQDSFESQDRESAPANMQEIMRTLGNVRFASYRPRFNGTKCEANNFSSGDVSWLNLDHLYLDDLDLGDTDFSCVAMSQAKLRRVNFRGARLNGADLRGVTLGDFMLPGFPKEPVGDWLYRPEQAGGVAEWQRYRCWVTDFRNADLEGTNFEGANLAGADFQGANFRNTNLCRADISRANFRGAKNLKREMLLEACVGLSTESGEKKFDTEQPLTDFKNFEIPRCQAYKKCPPSRLPRE